MHPLEDHDDDGATPESTPAYDLNNPENEPSRGGPFTDGNTTPHVDAWDAITQETLVKGGAE